MKLEDLFKKYIGEITYGAIDGLVTTFAVIAGSEGAGFSTKVIIILALANVIADGFSMSVGCYFSVKNGKSSRGKEVESILCFQKALATFIAFVIMGMCPLFIYLINMPEPFIHSAFLTGMLFLLIGSWKSMINKGAAPFKQAISTLFFGSIACTLFWIYSLHTFILGGINFTEIYGNICLKIF